MSLSPPRVSILIVSYNTREMTHACIRSVYEQAENRNFEIIVVDNQSVDGSAEAIEQSLPDVRLIRSNENLGFARANNLAAKEASGDYILLLNPDTVVLDHAIDRLVAFAEKHPEAKIWGGRTLRGDRTLDPTSCWREMTVWSLFSQAIGLGKLFPKSERCNYEGYGGWHRDTVREVDIVTGCFLLTTRQLWEELNGFDPIFFMYGEEADFCLRARERSARPMFTPNSTIIHYGGASETIAADKFVKLFSGRITLVTRHWSPLGQSVARLLFQLWALARLVGFALATAAHGKQKYRQGFSEWRTIWKRRDEWIHGWQNISPPKKN